MVGTALPILSSLAPMLLDTQAESSRAGRATNGRSAFTVWKRLYLLLCHVTRIREALQAVSAEKRKNRLQGVDLLEVEPLVCRVRVMVSQEGAGLFIQSFGARGAAELLEQHYAFPIHQAQIPAAQHELYPSVAILIAGIQICSGL